MARTIVVGPRDYKAVADGKPLMLRGHSPGMFNGDRVRIIMRDMCEHEGLSARVAGVQHDLSRGQLCTVHTVELDN